MENGRSIAVINSYLCSNLRRPFSQLKDCSTHIFFGVLMSVFFRCKWHTKLNMSSSTNFWDILFILYHYVADKTRNFDNLVNFNGF